MRLIGKLLACVMVGISVFIALALLVSVALGVWIPDLFSQKPIVVGHYDSGSMRVSLIQHWNGSDFYTTLLSIETPNDHARFFMVEGDSKRIFSNPSFHDDSSKLHIKIGDCFIDYNWSSKNGNYWNGVGYSPLVSVSP